jgi:DNA repair exonuclease SbcCD ATPase subunit
MADAIVEIFGEKDPFRKGRESAKDFLTVLDTLVDKAKFLGSTFRKEIESIEFKGLKDVSDFNKQLEGLNSTLESNNKLRDSQVEINKKLKDSQKASTEETKKGAKVEKEALKVSKETNKAIEVEIGLLDKLQKEQKDQLKSIESIKEENKDLTKQKRELTKALDKESESYGEQLKQIEDLTEGIIDNREEIKKQNKQARDQQKLIESINTLRDKEIKSIDDLRKQNVALRNVRNQLDLSTEQNIELSQTFNDKINENTELLKENGDANEQAKINVGNYTGSILDALDQTGLFGEAVGAVRSIQDAFIKTQEASVVATNADTAAKKANQKATTRLGKATQLFNKIAKASGVLLIIAAVTSLVGVLTQGRAGAIKLQQGLQTLGVVAKGVLEVLANVGIVVFNSFKVAFKATQIFFNNFEVRILRFKKSIADVKSELSDALSSATFGRVSIFDEAAEDSKKYIDSIKETEEKVADLAKEQAELTEELSKSSDAVIEGVKEFGRLGDAVETVNDNIIKGFEIGDQINFLKNKVAELNQELSTLEQISEDATISLSAQKNAIEEVLIQTEKLNKANEDVARLELDRANRAVLADLELRRDSLRLTAGQVAEFKRQAETDVVAFAENIEKLRRAAGVTSTLGDEDIDAQQEALRAFIDAETVSNEGILRARTTRRQILQDQVEQELDFLFDAFDRRKQLIEQEIGDERVSVEARLALRDQLVKDFKKNLGQELDLFDQLRKARKAEIDQILKDPNVIGTQRKLLQEELRTLENELDFDKLKNITDFKELNKDLKELGLSEIGVNRFKELIVETDAFNKDLIDTNKELDEVKTNFEELTNLLTFDDADTQVIKSFNDELNNLFDNNGARVDLLALSDEDFKKITDSFKKAEEDAKTLQKDLAIARSEEEKDQIEKRLKDSKDGSVKFLKLQSELAKKELQIEKLKQEGLTETYQDAKKTREELQKEESKNRLERIKQFGENSQKLLNSIETGFSQRVEDQLNVINGLLDENREIQSELRDDAKDGLVEAEESLTIQKRKEQELEQERIRLQKQEKQRQLAFAFIKIFNTKLTEYQSKVENARSTGVATPRNNVLVDTVTEFGLTSGIASSIAGFIDGTEHVAKSMGAAPLGGMIDNYLGAVGGQVFRFDGNEAILNPTQNKMRGNLSNDETVDVAHRYLKGDLIEKSKVFDTAISMTNALMALNSLKQNDNSGEMIKALRMDMRTLTGEIKKLPSAMPTSHSGFNNKTGMVEHITKKLGREQTIMERLNRS